MKQGRIGWALVGLGILAATVAYGQNVQDMGTWYRNPQSGAKVSSTGDAYVNEASKDRDNWIVYTNAINDTISEGAKVGAAWTAASTAYAYCAESTAVLTAAPYKKFAIFVRVIPVGGDTTTSALRFAIQVRGHTSALADTASTFYWTGWDASGVAAGDSSGTGTTAQAGNGQLPWPGERVVDFDPRRGRAGDVNTFGQYLGSPAGKLFDLVDSKGNWFWAPYLSVRVRYLGGYNVLASKPRIIVHVVMGS